MSAMIEHLWQSTLVIGLLFLVGLWMRNAPGRLLNLLWWAALAKLFLPWAVLGRLMARLADWFAPGTLDALSLSDGAPAGLAAFVAPMHLVVVGSEDGAEALVGNPAIWLLLWLAGAVCIVVMWTIRGAPERDRAVQAGEGADTARTRVAVEARAAGIPAERITLVEGRDMPRVAGWLRPRILLPFGLVEVLDPTELRALLLHEDAHRRRRDPLLSTFGRLAVLCFYYYPLVWPVLRRLRATTEMACDERVLAADIPREIYARALARTIGHCLATPAASPAAAGRSASLLRKRIQRISRPWRIRAMPRHRIALTLGCLAVLGGSFLPGVPVTVSATSGGVEAELLYDSPQRIELRRLATCDRIVRGDFDDASTQGVLRALALEGDLDVTFSGKLPPLRREQRLGGLTLEEALLEVAKQTGVFYRVPDEHTLNVSAPFLAGVGDVTNPVLIPESKVEPVYPEEAKESALSGVVILQAVILEDGTVANIEILQRRPEDDPGFAESAREAVAQWRYEPATVEGTPVPVYFTVFIEFKLQ